MNQIIITGRIISNSEKSDKNYMYYPANGDKQSFLHCLLSTQKEGAQKDENGYYPTFIVPMKAFGPTADQIHQYFGEGQNIEVFGVLLENDPYKDPQTGAERKGGLFIKANRIVYGFGGKPKDEVTSTVATATRSLHNPTPQRRVQSQNQSRIVAPF